MRPSEAVEHGEERALRVGHGGVGEDVIGGVGAAAKRWLDEVENGALGWLADAHALPREEAGRVPAPRNGVGHKAGVVGDEHREALDRAANAWRRLRSHSASA